jgi:hypothetical protein
MLLGNTMEPLLDSNRAKVEVSTMTSRAIVRQLVKELMQAQSDADELRKRVRKILNRRKHKDEDDDDPD